MKKLRRTDRATSSRPCGGYGLGGEGLDLHSVAKVSQAFDQASFLLVVGATIEVTGAKVLIHGPVLEHVIDGRKDGGGDGDDCLLGAAPGFDAMELGLEVAAFFFTAAHAH